MSNGDFANFIFELGHLRRIKHEGWRLAGVDHPDSVAEHVLRAAQIGYVLARMEGVDNPHEVVSMAVFHDIGECRIGDIHKVANKYIDADEKGAVREQVEGLEEVGEDIFDMWCQVDERSSEAGIIAKDADLLEQAFTAKEYLERGYATEEWIENVGKCIQTDSAKDLWTELQKIQSTDWWSGLKKI